MLTYFSTTNVNANADPTGKGVTIAQDYLAGTNPTNASSKLLVTSGGFSSGGTSVGLTFSSVPTRFYYLQESLNLTTNWSDSGLGLISPSAGSTTTVNFTDTSASVRFYRIEAVLPLMP